MIEKATSSGSRRDDGGDNPSISCPQPEEIFEWLAGDLEADRAEVLRDHARGCADCAREIELVGEFQSESTGAESAADLDYVRSRYRDGARQLAASHAGARRRDGWRIAVAGVAAALLAFVFLPLDWSAPFGEARVPELGDDAAYRGRGIELVEPTGECASKPEAFRWRTEIPSAAFRLVVTDVAGVEVLSLDCPAEVQSLDLPATGLRADTRYRWRVESRSADGITTRSADASFLWRTSAR